MDWSLDGRQLVTVARDQKNTLRVFHVFTTLYKGLETERETPTTSATRSTSWSADNFQPSIALDGRRDQSGNKLLARQLDDVLRVVNDTKTSGANRGGIGAPTLLFSATTLVGLPPAVRAIGWTGVGQFVSCGEKGHVEFWTFEATASMILICYYRVPHLHSSKPRVWNWILVNMGCEKERRASRRRKTSRAKIRWRGFALLRGLGARGIYNNGKTQ